MQRRQSCFGNEHPDLALLDNSARHGICCVVLRDVREADAQALCELGAFYAFRQGRCTALLFAQDCGFAGAQALEARLAQLGLQAGLSGPFALAASARGCMLKAQLALNTGLRTRPGRTLYSMDEFGEEALLLAAQEALAQQGYLPSDFCDAALERMRCADVERDTRYVESLHAYLSCGMDLKRAAQQLGVHRNTLAYRMERVQALFDLDLKDISRCFELLFSLWLLRRLPGQPDEPAEVEAFDVSAAQEALWRHIERNGGEETGGAFPCALMAVGISALADEGQAALIGRIRGCAPVDTAFAFDEDVLLMALPPDRAEGFEAQLRMLCAGMGCPVAVTQAFPSSRLKQRARICRMALCAASSLFTRTRDLCSTLFFMAVESQTSLAPYLCEDVIRVMDDDAQKGTALSRSLYAYLLHFRDMKRAAQQIGMHRNTMEYHIRKIDALIGSDMDGARRFMIMCTYKMLALPENGRYGA